MVCQSSQSSVAVMSGCVVVSVLFRFLFFLVFFFFFTADPLGICRKPG